MRKHRKNKLKSKKVLGIVLAVAAVAALTFGIIQFNYSTGGIGNFADMLISANTETGEIVYQSVPQPAVSEVSENISVVEQIEEPKDFEIIEPEPEPERIENPYRDYYLQNEDMVAWLYIPDTPVDYPVMYTPDDEEYYLQRGFDKKGNANGCLILDTDSSIDPLSTNLIIHGHCMQNGAMFGTLSKYEKEDYCREHSTIYLFDKDREHIYEVVSVFRSQVFKVSDECFKYYKFFNAETPEEFAYFYYNIKEMSEFDTGVEAEFGDSFITLSTCAYHVKNGRLVVVAKEIEAGDYYLPCTEEKNENKSDNM